MPENTPVTLRDWFVQAQPSDPFKAPEQVVKYLTGNVEGHPKFEDGDKVSTSAIVDAEGSIITVASGRKYLLEGPPLPEWVAWMEENSVAFNLEAPIRMLP